MMALVTGRLRPVLWAFYRKERQLVQVIDVDQNGSCLVENCSDMSIVHLSFTEFSTAWTRVTPASDEDL